PRDVGVRLDGPIGMVAREENDERIRMASGRDVHVRGLVVDVELPGPRRSSAWVLHVTSSTSRRGLVTRRARSSSYGKPTHSSASSVPGRIEFSRPVR